MNLRNFARTLVKAESCCAQRQAEAKESLHLAELRIADAQRTIKVIRGLRAGDRPGHLFDPTGLTYLLVWNYRGFNAMLNHGIKSVNALIVPELIEPEDRFQVVATNPAGHKTMESRPYSVDQLVQDVLNRYAAGRVSVGRLEDAQTAPCRDCGQPALLVLEHGRDSDSDTNWLTLYELCLACPIAHLRGRGPTVDCRQSNPALPFRAR